MMFNFGQGGASKGSMIPVAKDKKLCVITGTTSGLGKSTARALINSGEYHVVCAVRDVEKMESIAVEENLDQSAFTCMELDLGSYASTNNFFKEISKRKNRPLDRLVCNAAVYQPALDKPKYTVDDHEEQLQINHLSHFLLTSLFLPEMAKLKDARVTIVGSITGNSNTIGGGLVLPLADLADLKGLREGGKNPVSMIDGKAFNGAKAYKDSKICNMMTVNELHKRFHSSTGVVFNSMYPGCIATTNLFREKRGWFRTLFPLFMKYVTGGFVSEEEAGDRLAQCVAAPECTKSGVYWSWNGGARQIPTKDWKKGVVTGTGGGGGEIFENTPSDQVADPVKSEKMWNYSTAITGAKWPK